MSGGESHSDGLPAAAPGPRVQASHDAFLPVCPASSPPSGATSSRQAAWAAHSAHPDPQIRLPLPCPAGCITVFLSDLRGSTQARGQWTHAGSQRSGSILPPATVLCFHGTLGPRTAHTPWACSGHVPAVGAPPIRPGQALPGVSGGEGEATSGFSRYRGLLLLGEAQPAEQEWQLLPWGETQRWLRPPASCSPAAWGMLGRTLPFSSVLVHWGAPGALPGLPAWRHHPLLCHEGSSPGA